MKKIGIDDAGRGPVIGPMILTGLIIEEENEAELTALGARDSKTIYPKQRKRLAEQFKTNYTHHTQITQPKEIDDFPNLNTLEAIKCAIIINTLIKDLDEQVKVVVDCPSINTTAWKATLLESIVKKDQIDLIVEHKADDNHPSVSAASIIAKETREDEIKQLKKELNIDFGSGYPADPKTKDFLVKTYGDKKYDTIIRKSWSTYKKLKDKFSQQSLHYL